MAKFIKFGPIKVEHRWAHFYDLNSIMPIFSLAKSTLSLMVKSTKSCWNLLDLNLVAMDFRN